MPANRRKPASPSRATGTERYAALTARAHVDEASFTRAPEGSLAAALDRVLSGGDAIMFSRTSDGGAICILVITGDERVKKYVVSQTELDQLLAALELL